MSLLLLIAIGVPVLLALFHVWRATQGVGAIKRIFRLDTTPLRDIREGLVEVEGTIAALETPLVAPSGRAAVFADVELHATRGGGRNTVTLHRSHTQRSVAAELTSDDGTRVKLDFEHLEVVGGGDAFLVGMTDQADVTRAWTTAVPTEATSLGFQERIVAPGARVVVSGVARIVDATVDARSTGYRDGVPVEKKTFVIAGTPDTRMLVAPGSARQLLWRAIWPVAVLGLTALAGLTYASLLLAILLG